jgi:XTP/dITP diphosphohydrolase
VTRRHRLVLASGNRHKLEELRGALPAAELGLVEAPGEPPPEDGETYEDNARIKARWARGHAPAGTWAVGEDSGIEAAALDGRPGVRTARWAAGDPVGRMLEALAANEERGARYVCVIVAVDASGRELVATGTLEGAIADAAAGVEGFGFDPVFVPRGETRTVAELGNEWKRRHSHRSHAAAELAALLDRQSSVSARFGCTSRPSRP